MSCININKAFHRFILCSLFCICFALLGSCGFSSIYKQQQSKDTVLRDVAVESIDNCIEGADLYHQLSLLFPDTYSSLTKYILKTDIKFSEEIAILEDNADISRQVTTVSISFKLVSRENHNLILEGNFTRSNFINNSLIPYNNMIKKRQTQKSLMMNIAREIRNRIFIFLINKQNDKGLGQE